MTPNFGSRLVAAALTSGMPRTARSLFQATLLASSLLGCGGRASDTCGACDDPSQLPGSTLSELDLSSTDAVALMRAQVPPSAKLMSVDNDPQGWLTLDGTSRSWFVTFEDEETQQAWFGRISTLSGVATVSLEPKLYIDCPGPGVTDLSSTKLVPDALRRVSAAEGASVYSYRWSYSEAAPCVVANVANTVGALLTGHSVLSSQIEGGQPFWSYYDDQGRFSALCGPCKTGSGDCMNCKR